MNKIIALSALILIISGCSNNPQSRESKEITKIKIAAVSNEKLIIPVHASGFLVPAKEIRLSFKTGGIINAINADDGTRVKKDNLLASLDMSEIEAQVNQAINGYEKSLRDFIRARNLYGDTVATLEQLQNAETALNVAKSMRDAALFNREHSRIIAPEDGVILKRLAQIHEVIAPGYPVFILGTSDTHWNIKASLADRDFVRIVPGDSATVTFDAYPGEQFIARVSKLSETSNPMTGTYEIELELMPVKVRLASGFLAKVEIFPSRPEKYFRIPVEALVGADGKHGFVYTVNDSLTVRKTHIKIAEVYQSWISVDSGLHADEVVATEGSAYLTDREKVEIIK